MWHIGWIANGPAVPMFSFARIGFYVVHVALTRREPAQE
jgi:hypothetical protein